MSRALARRFQVLALYDSLQVSMESHMSYHSNSDNNIDALIGVALRLLLHIYRCNSLRTLDVHLYGIVCKTLTLPVRA